MRMRTGGLVSAAAVLAAGLLIAPVLIDAQTMGQPERFSAMAVNMNVGRTGTVEIVVNRWSTDAERTGLVQTALEKGPDKLLSTLQKLPRVGYIRSPESVGWDLHYAHHVALPDGGEQIVIATDRPIGFREASRQPRSIDYPFTVIEMRLNADGEGQGTMSVATKVIAEKDKQTITLENFSTTPVLLQSVKRERQSQ